MTDEEIIQELENMDKEAKNLKNDLIRIVWWMRGGITYDQAWNLSLEERKNISNLIKENIETGKKTGIPIF